MKALLFLLLFLPTSSAFASEKADILIEEYTRIKQWVESVEPDGLVGGLYYYVEREGYIILFSQKFDGKHETIRFFLNREAPLKDFAITYIKSKYILKDRTILRRFIGSEPTGWKNQTVDVTTLEDLGSQGVKELVLSPDEKQIIAEWGLTVF